MPEMPSECRVEEAVAFRLGFFLGASAFYGSRLMNSSSPVAIKHQYIQHEWDRLARTGAISSDYLKLLVDSASSEEVD